MLSGFKFERPTPLSDEAADWTLHDYVHHLSLIETFSLDFRLHTQEKIEEARDSIASMFDNVAHLQSSSTEF
ncbi:hypothetical protein ABK905_18225 [Acerihabitans sp. KWT182]|uniref:DinB family protein n=1 Tax=Acerihabitans sp. KWT182 TaxID=3157919 RepID=A0AAU7Q696_9GAMM